MVGEYKSCLRSLWLWVYERYFIKIWMKLKIVGKETCHLKFLKQETEQN